MTVLNYTTEPRQFLEYLFNAAVKRALPLHNTAAYLPKPPGAVVQAVSANLGWNQFVGGTVSVYFHVWLVFSDVGRTSR